MNRDTGSATGIPCIVKVISALALLCLICAPATAVVQSFNQQTDHDQQVEGIRTTVTYRFEGRSQDISSGNWVPSSADLLVAMQPGSSGPGRSYRLEIFAVEKGERVMVEVPGLQEWEKQTRKWMHSDVTGAEAVEGRWIWTGTFRPGDTVVIQWKDNDTGRVVPHPVTVRIVESFGAKLAFATPVSVVFPVSGEATLTASAGFSVRYYRVSNASMWRSLNRIGFPSIAFSYATIGGRKSVLYSVGFSALEDQLHLYYGGFRNDLMANNFWMVGLSLKTNDLMAAAKRALK